MHVRGCTGVCVTVVNSEPRQTSDRKVTHESRCSLKHTTLGVSAGLVPSQVHQCVSGFNTPSEELRCVIPPPDTHLNVLATVPQKKFYNLLPNRKTVVISAAALFSLSNSVCAQSCAHKSDLRSTNTLSLVSTIPRIKRLFHSNDATFVYITFLGSVAMPVVWAIKSLILCLHDCASYPGLGQLCLAARPFQLDFSSALYPRLLQSGIFLSKTRVWSCVQACMNMRRSLRMSFSTTLPTQIICGRLSRNKIAFGNKFSIPICVILLPKTRRYVFLSTQGGFFSPCFQEK